MSNKQGQQDLAAGFIKGIIGEIDRRAEDKQREAKLDRDIRKHKITKQYDMQLRKDWMKELEEQMPQDRDYIKETLPNVGTANIADYTRDAPAGQAPIGGQAPISGQVPVAETRETPEGRELGGLEVDVNKILNAREPYATSTGVSTRKIDEPKAYYNALQRVKQHRELTPEEQDNERKILNKRLDLGTGEKEEKLTQGKRSVIGDIRAAKSSNRSLEDIHKMINLEGWEPEDFAEELEGYSPQIESEEVDSSILENVKQFIGGTTINKVSQVVDFIMGQYNKTKEEAVRIIQQLQGQEDAT